MSEPATVVSQDTSSEYLTFLLDDEEFGLNILSVKEIRVMSPVTAIPGTPSYLKGVINLRGVIVPIVDLRERFGHSPREYSPSTVVIVLSERREGREHMVGIVVDAVAEVYKVARADIRETPDFGSAIETRFLLGMATVFNKIVILLDAGQLLDAEELYSAARQARAV